VDTSPNSPCLGGRDDHDHVEDSKVEVEEVQESTTPQESSSKSQGDKNSSKVEGDGTSSRDEEDGSSSRVERDDKSNEASSSGGPQGESSNARRYPLRERRPLGDWWMNHVLPQHVDEHANMVMLGDPLSLCEAMRSTDASKWEQAMQEEYESLIANGTWELVELPQDRTSVGCKWVFCTKRDANGDIVRYKARLVAKGYSQVEGMDFNETFAPVAKFSTIRCVLALGASMDLEMHQMDVKTAFLKPFLKEVIYMDQPEGFVQRGREHLKCKLRKTIYGLRQSGREWYNDITTFFTKEGFYRSHADYSLFIKRTSSYLLIVLIYVDDLIMLASDKGQMQALKKRLHEKFDIKDLGDIHYFIGV
jgi:hypothetical protein